MPMSSIAPGAAMSIRAWSGSATMWHRTHHHANPTNRYIRER